MRNSTIGEKKKVVTSTHISRRTAFLVQTNSLLNFVQTVQEVIEVKIQKGQRRKNLNSNRSLLFFGDFILMKTSVEFDLDTMKNFVKAG